MQTFPIQFQGISTWVQRPSAPEPGVAAVVKRYFSNSVKAILTSPDNITLDIYYQTTLYTVMLDRDSGCIFRGKFIARENANSWDGIASGRLLQTNDGYLLFGSWIEDLSTRIEDTWWVDLQEHQA